MKTHFDPYMDDEFYDGPAPCGTIIGEEYNSTSLWEAVTCKRCLKKKAKLVVWFKETEEFIIDQMGDMADFFKFCKEKCKSKDCGHNCPQIKEVEQYENNL